MIFDNVVVTEHVIKWQGKKNPKRLDRILKLTTPLIEAIVSSYDSSLREDMIQAAYVKLLRACELFNSDSGTTLHTYFTTVIHNSCRTVMKSEYKHLELFDSVTEDLDEEDVVEVEEEYKTIIDTSSIITYCRNRFPLLDANLVDYVVVACVNYYINYGNRNIRTYYKILANELKIEAKTVDMLFKVILILLRYMHIEDVIFKTDDNGNVSTCAFMPELIYTLGEDIANVIVTLFAGISMKF